MAKIKYYNLHGTATDSNGEKHIVTVVGKFTQEYFQKTIVEEVNVADTKKGFTKGTLTYPRKTLKRTLTTGLAICHPTDEFDEEFGIELAKARINKGKDAGTIETNDVTMITEDLIMAELLGKLTYVCANIDKYIV